MEWQSRKVAFMTFLITMVTVMRPAMVFGLEAVEWKKRQEAELESPDMKMFSFGLTQMSKIRNKFMKLVGVSEEDAEDRVIKRNPFICGDP